MLSVTYYTEYNVCMVYIEFYYASRPQPQFTSGGLETCLRHLHGRYQYNNPETCGYA